jgi:multidrug efflux pump subunit AcrB
MIKAIISFSARHPVSVLSTLGGLILLGLAASFIIPLDFLPAMDERMLIVSAEYPGVTAEEIRSMVTVPLEDAFSTLGGLKSLSSVSREGLSLVRVELHWGTDTDLALAESREIIDICYEGLPSLCSKPKVIRESGIGKDSITIILIPLDGDLRYGRRIAETDIKPRLQRVPGAAMVTVSGGEEEEIQVRFQKASLEARGLDLASAANIIAASNFEYPGGSIREGDREYSVKTAGLYQSLEEIRDTPLAIDQGGALRVGDMAEIVRDRTRQDTFFLYNGMECIRIGIRKQQSAAPLPLSFKVKGEIENLNTLYGPWYQFIIAEDLSDQILESLYSLLVSALAAALASALVVYLFLRSIKLSLVITGIIPLSALAAVLLLGISGRSLNLMSLSGMAIGIGMVIDAGVVALEQIDGEIDRAGGKAGELWPEPVIAGVLAVAKSSGASALSTVIVFIPVFFIPGLPGELFGDMAIAVIGAISFSCVLSFTYVPALVTLMRPAAHNSGNGNGIPRIIRFLEKNYAGVLRRLLRKPVLVLIPLGVCLGIGIFSLGFSRFTLLPELANRSISWEIAFSPGTSLEKIRRIALELNRGLENIGEIKALEITGGIGKDDYPRLADPKEVFEKLRFTGHIQGKTDLVRAAIEENLRGTPYTAVFTGSGDLLSQLLNTGGTESIIRGENPETVLAQASALTAAGQPDFVPHVIQSSPIFTPDRLALARFSLSAQYAAQSARNALEGITQYYYEGGREIPLVIKLREDDIKSPEDLGLIRVNYEGGSVPLRLLGSMEEEQNEGVYYRYNRRDAKIFPYPVEDGQKKELGLISPGEEETAEMIRAGLLLLGITLCLLYLSMGAQFESFLIPLILLLAIPPSFAGAFFLLLVSSVKPDINSIIALVILFGISINNSILLYESCEAVAGDITGSCVKKLRAILITNVTTLVSLLPFAFDPLGINSQASLAIALIGGLAFSLVLVLLLVPLCIASLRRKP